MKARPLYSLLFLAAACWASSAPAQDKAEERKPPEADAAQKERIEAALKLTVDAAGKYEIKGGEKEPAKAKLIAEPVLRWSNPNVGEIYGNVFLWTAGERPVAIGSLFKWFSPHKNTSHEFMSLTEQKLAAAYDDKEVWVSKQPGLAFVPLKGAEPPADSALRRQAQMRQLARRFTANETTREGEKHELRMLSQPIYKYEAPQEKVASGGVFSFVLGTDPEIVFLLEARGDKPAWHVAAARLQNCALQLKFDGKKVWSVEQLEWSVAFDHSQPYTLFDTPGK